MTLVDSGETKKLLKPDFSNPTTAHTFLPSEDIL